MDIAIARPPAPPYPPFAGLLLQPAYQGLRSMSSVLGYYLSWISFSPYDIYSHSPSNHYHGSGLTISSLTLSHNMVRSLIVRPLSIPIHYPGLSNPLTLPGE